MGNAHTTKKGRDYEKDEETFSHAVGSCYGHGNERDGVGG